MSEPLADTGRSRNSSLLRAADSALLVVDMQESLLNGIHARDALIAQVTLLGRAAHILGIPIFATTQYQARLGEILPAVRDAVGAAVCDAATDKLCFSCAQSEDFMRALGRSERRQIVICGVETHICVSQTAHDLAHQDYFVHVAADAVSARTLEKHKLGMERIRDAGIRPCAAEAAVYEWLEQAGTPEFKEVLRWVKTG